uniref:Membrane transporter protein n=1 Tax=Alexandrium monilatum TaxID=311494 RepID=A0A7S4SFN2_9DINO|mmetsp:Transcript_43657/g.130415  ORF Transcript_43657/g.130415 Transcript_43657/m.130415 type:complete len:381 (-) Transcript_43657:66-1208(-)
MAVFQRPSSWVPQPPGRRRRLTRKLTLIGCLSVLLCAGRLAQTHSHLPCPDFDVDLHGLRRALRRARPAPARGPALGTIAGAPVSQLLMAAPLAAIAGLVGGVAGFGNGIVCIQGLMRLPGLRLTQLQACASSLGPSVLCSLWGGCVWIEESCGDLTLAVLLAVCGIPGVAFGARVAALASEATLRCVFAFVLCCILCPLLLLQLLHEKEDASPPASPAKRVKIAYSPEPQEDAPLCDIAWPSGVSDSCFLSSIRRLLRNPAETARHCLMGALVGVLTGSIGVGDVPLFIAYLVRSGFSHRQATGMAMLATVPTNAFGALLHMFEGNAVAALVPILAAFMSLGAHMGAKLSCGLSEEKLKLGFVVLVLFFGLFLGWEVME